MLHVKPVINAAATAGMAIEEIDLRRPSRLGGTMQEQQMDTIAEVAPTLPAPQPGRSVLQQMTRAEIAELAPQVRLQLEEDHRLTIAAAEAQKAQRRAAIVGAVALRLVEPDADENLHPGVIRSLEAEAAAAFGAARAVVGESLDVERVKMRAAGGGLPGYAAALRAYAVRWLAIAALPDGDAALLAGSLPGAPAPIIDPIQKLAAAQRLAGIRPAPGFDPRALIASLAARGVTLAEIAGELTASPAGMLDEVARQQLRQHAAAVLAALQTRERI